MMIDCQESLLEAYFEIVEAKLIEMNEFVT